MTFIDAKKAFNSVQYENIIKEMNKINFEDI